VGGVAVKADRRWWNDGRYSLDVAAYESARESLIGPRWVGIRVDSDAIRNDSYELRMGGYDPYRLQRAIAESRGYR
jgi:hypothetical protein